MRSVDDEVTLALEGECCDGPDSIVLGNDD